MTEVNTTPTLCTHDHNAYDAKADKQYHDLRTGLNAIIATHAQELSKQIANPETDDVLRLVRIGGDVFGHFLAGIDESIRQQYNCRTCKQFFNGFGSLAFLTKELKVIPLAFPTDESVWLPLTGEVFEQAYRNVLAAFDVKSVSPMTVAMHAEMGDFLGTSERGGFNHICHTDVVGIRAFLEGLLIDTVSMGHGFGQPEMVQIHDAFRKYNELVVEKAFAIPRDRLRERDLYELDLCVKMTKDYMSKNADQRTLWVTRYLMDLGLGIVHFKNSVVGALIEDLQKLSAEDALNNYYAYTDPVKYKRKVALPTEKQFEESVKFLEDNDYTRKLEMRFATMEEVLPIYKWVPTAKTADVFAALRSKVKNEDDAKRLALPAEQISISGFNTVLEELIEKGELKSIGYKSEILQYGIVARNVADDAGDAYVDGSIIHPFYMAETAQMRTGHVKFDSHQVHGIFTAASNGGRKLYVLSFGGGEVNFGIRPLNYVETLNDELKPHQRMIDAWDKTKYLNPTDAKGNPLAVQNTVILVPAVVNRHAVISLITDACVQDFIITSER